MGRKYMIDAFNYPYGGAEAQKQCGTLISCMFWIAVLSIKFDGVNLTKRGK